MSWIDKLISDINSKESCVVVGLDPRIDKLPKRLVPKDALPESAASAIVQFNRGVIEAVKDKAVAVKPQIAFYEIFGAPGWSAYFETARIAQSNGLAVIGDIKRGDIGSTAVAYAEAHLGADSSFDAVTLNPYMGSDSVLPFVEIGKLNGKGAFVLVKTSNPSSDEFQNQRIGEETLYEKVAHKVKDWGNESMGSSGFSNIGAVVGATYPEEAVRIREILPHAFFLVPGYGAQGGKAADLKAIFCENGLGIVVNSSRGIIFAFDPSDGDGSWQQAVADAAETMRKDLEAVRN